MQDDLLLRKVLFSLGSAVIGVVLFSLLGAVFHAAIVVQMGKHMLQHFEENGIFVEPAITKSIIRF